MEKAYVVVEYIWEEYKYNYYFTFYDEDGYSMKLTNSMNIKDDGTDIDKNTEINKSTITSQMSPTSTSIVVIPTLNQDLENNCTINF